MRFLPHLFFPKVSSSRANEVRHKEVPEQYAMLKLSFNVKNIQNSLQRHYCRGQIILFWIKFYRRHRWNQKQSSCENNQNNRKRQYGSNRIVLWSKDKMATLLFSSNSSKTEKGWIRSNQISSFVRKIIKTFWKGQYGSSHIVANSNFLKIFET